MAGSWSVQAGGGLDFGGENRARRARNQVSDMLRASRAGSWSEWAGEGLDIGGESQGLVGRGLEVGGDAGQCGRDRLEVGREASTAASGPVVHVHPPNVKGVVELFPHVPRVLALLAPFVQHLGEGHTMSTWATKH